MTASSDPAVPLGALPTSDPPAPARTVPPAAPRRLRFGRKCRLQHRDEYAAVFKRKCSARDASLLVFASPNGLDVPRLGLSVGKKVGGAVQRNAWKRRIREAFRLERHALPTGMDFVVVPAAATRPHLLVLRESLRSTARRAAKRVAKPLT